MLEEIAYLQFERKKIKNVKSFCGLFIFFIFLYNYLQKIVLMFDSLNCFPEKNLNPLESNIAYQSGGLVQ